MGVIGTIKGVNVIEQHIREYERKLLMSLHQARFALAEELNWNRNHAPTPANLLRLKKPILQNRWWINFREGWSKERWGFANADLTPYEIEKAAEKLHETFRDPQYREAIGSLALKDGFKGIEVET